MRMTRMDQGMAYPAPINYGVGSAQATTTLLALDWNSNQKKIAVIFNCPASGTLDGVECFLAGTRNVATSVKFSFQDLDGSGLPDGTPDQYRSGVVLEVTGIWVPSGIMSSDGTDNGTKRTVIRGQRLACVIEFDSGFANDNVGLGVFPVAESEARYATFAHYNGTVWVFDDLSATGKGIAQMGIKYDPVFINDTNDDQAQTWFNMPEMIPASSIAYETFNDASTPNHRGLQFVFDTDVLISGIVANLYLVDGVDTEVEAVLLGSPDEQLAVLATKTKTVLVAEAPNNGMRNVVFMFDQEILCRYGQYYRVYVHPTGSTNIGLALLQFDDTFKGLQLTGWGDYRGNEYGFGYDYGDGTFAQVEEQLEHLDQQPLISLIVRGLPVDYNDPSAGWTGYT